MQKPGKYLAPEILWHLNQFSQEAFFKNHLYAVITALTSGKKWLAEHILEDLHVKTWVQNITGDHKMMCLESWDGEALDRYDQIRKPETFGEGVQKLAWLKWQMKIRHNESITEFYLRLITMFYRRYFFRDWQLSIRNIWQ